MTKKRPSSFVLGSLLLLSTLSCSHSRLVGHYQSRKLDQYLDFEDEATEGGEGEWGDYEGDPLDPKPNEFEYDDDSTSNGKGSSGTSSGGHSWGKTDDESSGSASDGGDSESRGSTGASNSGFPGGSKGSSSGQSGGSKASNSYSGQSGGSREYSTNQSKGSTSHSNKEPSGNGGYGGSGGGSNGRGSSSSSHATGGVYFQNFTEKLNVKVPLIPVLFVFLLFFFLGMLFTACQFQNNPEGVFVNCCRLSMHITACVGKVAFNLYHCRLGEIPPIVFAMDDADDLTDDELERMKLRPNLERALGKEHSRVLQRTEMEMPKIKTRV